MSGIVEPPSDMIMTSLSAIFASNLEKTQMIRSLRISGLFLHSPYIGLFKAAPESQSLRISGLFLPARRFTMDSKAGSRNPFGFQVCFFIDKESRMQKRNIMSQSLRISGLFLLRAVR